MSQNSLSQHNKSHHKQEPNTNTATYSVRFSDSDKDIEGIKKILYATWPNHRQYAFREQEITFVVEKTDPDQHGQKESVGFAHCSCNALYCCSTCKALEKGRPVIQPRHNHYGWYLGWDFDETYILNRHIPIRNEYIDLISDYNSYLNQYEDRWQKLRRHMIHIRQFGIDIDHRHKGLGSFLMKYLVYCFSEGTMFGLEVEVRILMQLDYTKNVDFVKQE